MADISAVRTVRAMFLVWSDHHRGATANRGPRPRLSRYRGSQSEKKIRQKVRVGSAPGLVDKLLRCCCTANTDTTSYSAIGTVDAPCRTNRVTSRSATDRYGPGVHNAGIQTARVGICDRPLMGSESVHPTSLDAADVREPMA